MDTDKLLKEANDESVVWDIESFIAYMEYMGYEYKLQRLNGVSYNLYVNIDNCKILHIPQDIIRVELLYKTKPCTGMSIIISGTVRRITKDSLKSSEDIVHINKVYFQEFDCMSYTPCSFSGLSNFEIDQANMPIGALKICNLYNNCIIHSITNDRVKSERQSIRDSFNSVDFCDGRVDIYCDCMHNSFNKIKNATIIIHEYGTERLHSIVYNTCFNDALNCTIRAICNIINDKEERKSISLDSFNHLINTRVNLIDSKVNSVNSIFNKCKDVEEYSLQLPHSLVEVDYAYNGTKNQEIYITDKMVSLDYSNLGNDTRIIIDSNNGLEQSVFEDYNGGREISLVGGKITKVYGGLDIFLKYPELNNLLSLKEFTNKQFQYSKISKFDSYEYKDVQEITYGCFEGSSITEAYLRDNIVKIDEKAFSESGIQKVLIGKNCKYIGMRAFKETNYLSLLVICSEDCVVCDRAFEPNDSCMEPVVIVPKNSKTYENLKDNKYIRLRPMDNMEEYMNSDFEFGGKHKITDTMMSRIKIIANEDEYEFIEPIKEYGKHALTIYKIINSVENDKLTHDKSGDIIQDNLLDFSMYNIKLQSLINKKLQSIPNMINKRFNGYINLITSIVGSISKEVAIKYIKEIDISTIESLDILIYNNDSCVLKVNDKYIVVVLDKKLRYICRYFGYTGQELYNPLSIETVKKLSMNTAKRIFEHLEIGDSISPRIYGWNLGGVTFPDMNKRTMKNFKKCIQYNCVFIGCGNYHTLNSIYNQHNLLGGRQYPAFYYLDVLIYDVMSQQFVLLEAQIEFMSESEDLRKFIVLDKYYINEIDKIPVEYIKNIKRILG